MVRGTILGMDIAPQTSPVSIDLNALLALSPPGCVYLGPLNGIEVLLSVSAGTVTLEPIFYANGAWWPLGDNVTAPKTVTAAAAGVTAATGRFIKPSEGRFWALLKTGGGTISSVSIQEVAY